MGGCQKPQGSLRKPPMGTRIKIVNYMKFVECNTIPLGMWLIDGLELRSELIVLIYQKVSIFSEKTEEAQS